MELTILTFMLFAHIADDYFLQGILANMKQRIWWEQKVENLESTIYKHDYIVALLVHGFSWATMISIPLIVNIQHVSVGLFISIFINGFIHAYIDNEKANNHKINLIQDQLLHLAQIVFTFLIFS